MLRERLVQIAMLAVAAGALFGAGMLSGPIQSQRRSLKFDSVSAQKAIAKNPKAVLLQIAPGGLRAPFLTYLWIRSQDLKQEGRFYDAKQQRDLICDLMPNFPGVWGFHAWDMAYNISAATHTPQERWMWVSNGIRLLRDRALYYNPDDLTLHRELAWIFFHKIGENADEMHMTYKRRWVGLMHRVLGAPPLSDSSESAIEAFSRIAGAPESLDKLLADAEAADFVGRLKRQDVTPDEGFLDYYNLYGGDLSVTLPGGTAAPKPSGDRAKAIASLMRSDKYASGREKVLAFVRRKVLVERYRMDPKWMLELMKKYGPMDWRHVNAHAIYWATQGLRRAENLDLSKINALNAGRILLGSLKALTQTGLLYCTPNPNDPEEPFLDWGPDWRFIEPTNQAYLESERLIVGESGKLNSDKNFLFDAHVTYLSNAIQQAYIGGREKLAQKYFDEVRNVLKSDDATYQAEDLYEFVRAKRRQLGAPSVGMARALWFSALRSAYRALAGGNRDEYNRYRAFARRAYRLFVKNIGHIPRLKPLPFDQMERNFLATMLLEPRAIGLNMPLLVKSRLYSTLPLQMQKELYPIVAGHLQVQCRREGVDFDRAFPSPPGSDVILSVPAH